MRALPRSVKILRRILVSVFAFAGLSFLSVFLFYVVFFHRTPRSSESQQEIREELAALIPGGTVENASFVSDGNTIRGYFLHPENAEGILVFAMGKEAKIRDHLEEARAFTEDGWNVLIYYGTGCGASDGSSMVGLAQGKHDLAAALSWLSAAGGLQEESLVIYGHSMGAFAAASVTDEFPGINAAVCVAGFDNSPQLMISNARSKAGPLAWAGAPFIVLFEHILFGKDAGDTASDSLSSSGVPVLLIQFEGDPAVPADADIITCLENKKAPNAVSVRLGEPYANQHSSSVLAGGEALDSVLSFLSACR